MRTEARDYYCRIMDAYLDGRDTLICELHQEIRADHELYSDVWSFFTASMRRKLKEIIKDIGSNG